jgi:acyl carrier protein
MNATGDGVEFRRAQGYTLLEPDQLWHAIQLQCQYPRRTWLFGAPAVPPAEGELSRHRVDDGPGDAALQSLMLAFSEVTGRKADPSTSQRTFFELGVDSLRLSRFRHELERRYAVDVPMSVLYRCNTLERLYREILAPAATGSTCTQPATRASASRDVPLLRLLTGTDPAAAPLLLVPPAGGVVAPYHDFMSALPRDRDVWAFEDPYVQHTSGAEWEVGPLLERVSRNVLATLTRAPIVVAYSAGGTLAWALTEALNERGLPPPLVVLIDTYLIEHPRLLADTMHTLSLAVDGGWPAVAVRALFHTLRALSVPVPAGTRKVLSHSVMRRNSTLQNLFETHRFYHRWVDAPTGDTAWRANFEDSLDELCKIVQRSDPSIDLARFRQIFKHACILSPRRTLSFVPRPLANKVALFEVDKSGLTIKDLISRYTQRLVLHERVAVPSYREVRKDYFRFRQSSALTKHFICMYDPHFVKTVVARLDPLLASL